MTCPACRQLVKASHPDQFREHLRKCAPDAVSAVAKDQWRDVAAAVDAVEAHEATLLEDARRLSFRDGRTREEVARAGVSPDRVRSTLRRASRAVPLVADPTPLDVIHEDDDVLVVNKPPGLRFHPVHRFEGNSLLSRLIGTSAEVHGTVHGRGRGWRSFGARPARGSQAGHGHQRRVRARQAAGSGGRVRAAVPGRRWGTPSREGVFGDRRRRGAASHRMRRQSRLEASGSFWKRTNSRGRVHRVGAHGGRARGTSRVHSRLAPSTARRRHPNGFEKETDQAATPTRRNPARTDVRIVSSSRVTIDVNDDGDVTRKPDGCAGEGEAAHRSDAPDSVHMAHADLPILSDPVRPAHPMGRRVAVRGRVHERDSAVGG